MNSSQDKPSDRSTADVAIVCIHKGEVRSLLKRLDRQKSYTEGSLTVRGGFLGETTRVIVAEAGTGFARQRAAAHWLVETHQPRWMLSVGYSSSLSDNVHAGDLVLADEIRDTHGNIMPVRCTLKPGKRIHVGRMIVADEHPTTPEARKKLCESVEALAVDTTSLAVAQICYERNVRFLAIRGIIDELQEEIPETAAAMMLRADSRSVGSAIGNLFKGFSAVGELKSWRDRTVVASDNLDRFVSGVIEQIADLLERQKLDSSD